MYAPQPLLLVMRTVFGISEASASLMITAVLVPLSIAPLFYGYLLEAVPVKRLLTLAISLLAASELCIFFAGDFWTILALRLFQGLVIPAILTALMTYISTTRKGADMQHAFAIWVTAAIVGGFLGRLIAGAISTMFGWRYAFLGLFISLAACLIFVLRLSPAPKADFGRLSVRDAIDTLREPGFVRICILIACSFFVFASIPNFLPFRLNDISSGISEFRIAISYSGYLMGIVIAVASTRLVSLFGSEARTLKAGLYCLLASVLLFLVSNTAVIFANMFFLSAGFSLLQAVCPGYVNKWISHRKAVANGLYISIYYAGGALGSYLPGWIYTHFGWNYYIFCHILFGLTALFLAYGLRDRVDAH
jgi:MFS transporter, YNFM family, putative membrane transport protein